MVKQDTQGWGAKVIRRLADDLRRRFPDDRGLSLTNLKLMRQFAAAYPRYPFLEIPQDDFRKLPIGQVALPTDGLAM